MKNKHITINSRDYSQKLLRVQVTLACIFSVISIYISQVFAENSDYIDLPTAITPIFAIASSLALPVALVFISQLFIKWRGYVNGVRAFFYGALITLLSNVPSVFYLISHSSN